MVEIISEPHDNILSNQLICDNVSLSMPSKVGRFCVSLIEAAWLAAVILTPVFFNIYSSRIFEPDKISLLRSLAFIILTAWIVYLFDTGFLPFRKRPNFAGIRILIQKTPLLMPVFFMLVVTLLANLFSVTPYISFFGSYPRTQGTITFFSYLVFFASMSVFLREKEQINRLVSAIILASLPISFYGVMQRLQVDPILWGGNTTVRVASNLGNSIFVAAYLVMVFPLLIARLVESGRELIKRTTFPWLQLLRFLGYSFLAVMNLATIYFSGSRGPVLGWMAGVYFMALLLALYWHKRRLIWLIIMFSVLGAAFLVIFNLPGGPLTSLRNSPIVGRFGRLLDTQSNTAKVRLYIWRGVVELVTPHQPLEYPDGSKDQFNWLRPLIGYGPESMSVVYNRFYPPELGGVERRNSSPDRSHNETWDTLVTTGLLGFVAYLAVFLSVFFFGLYWLGFIVSPSDKILFFTFALPGGLVSGFVLVLWGGWAYLGVGVPFGVALGLLVFLGVNGIRHIEKRQAREHEPWEALLITALLAGVMAHFLEINFGIAIASTRLLFWSYSAMLLILGQSLVESKKRETLISSQTLSPVKQTGTPPIQSRKRKSGLVKSRSSQGNQPTWIITACWNGLLIALVLVTLGYCFILNTNRLPGFGNIKTAWTTLMVLLTWLVGAGLLCLELPAESIPVRSNKHSISWIKTYGFASVLAIGGVLPFYLTHTSNLALLSTFRPASISDLLVQSGRVNGLLTLFVVYQTALVLGLAYFISIEKNIPIRPTQPVKTFLTGGLAGIVCIITILWGNLNSIYADMIEKLADSYTRVEKWDWAVALQSRSIDQAPKQDQYYLNLGSAYIELAKRSETSADQTSLALRAEVNLQTAQRLNPLNTDHTANLARLHTWWATVGPDSQTKLQHAQIASDYYSRALVLSPNNARLWGEWSSLFLEQLQNPDQAWQCLEKALALDNQYNVTHALAGNFYLTQAKASQDPLAKESAFETALNYYRKAVDLSKDDQKARYLVSISNVYIDMSEYAGGDAELPNYDPVRLQLALPPLFDALKAEPTQPDQVSILGQLARIYLELGDKGNALQYIQSALDLATDNQRPSLEQLQAEIVAMP